MFRLLEMATLFLNPLPLAKIAKTAEMGKRITTEDTSAFALQVYGVTGRAQRDHD